MKKKRSWFARLLALVALAAAIVAVVVVASNTHLHNSSDKSGSSTTHTKTEKKQPEKKKPRTQAKTYEVQSGDTLTSIAHKEGMTVSELQALNPEVDAQTLIAGEVLQLQK